MEWRLSEGKNWFGTSNENWYGKSRTYFTHNDYDIESGRELGFIENKCDLFILMRFGLDENYNSYSTECWH